MPMRIDEEALVAGLEEGIGHTSTGFSSLLRGQRLRATACGLVAAAIHIYAQSEHIASHLLIGRPEVACDPEMQHVLPFLGEGLDSIVVDGAYSHFLGYVGMSLHYERVSGRTVFPPEKLLCFKVREAKLAVDSLVQISRAFQASNEHPVDEYGFDAGRGPLAGRQRRSFGKPMPLFMIRDATDRGRCRSMCGGMEGSWRPIYRQVPLPGMQTS